ncbi:predicted protein [Plenodomus lingam JN3]|uniref:Predicted protein n=1 Tax=Leptosphaeria maculans (strain JN3 / isolate v23.1.3 / race Av1-4-5-6-7-8) TaxID=985895 RepID=E4ZIZ0_LEPMJ|nr:predicted protein [Plenodomus lingam JN3]CBX91260.1 predicted protein [Plenodomus lingam JN3]
MKKKGAQQAKPCKGHGRMRNRRSLSSVARLVWEGTRDRGLHEGGIFACSR